MGGHVSCHQWIKTDACIWSIRWSCDFGWFGGQSRVHAKLLKNGGSPEIMHEKLFFWGYCHHYVLFKGVSKQAWSETCHRDLAWFEKCLWTFGKSFGKGLEFLLGSKCENPVYRNHSVCRYMTISCSDHLETPIGDTYSRFVQPRPNMIQMYLKIVLSH